MKTRTRHSLFLCSVFLALPACGKSPPATADAATQTTQAPAPTVDVAVAPAPDVATTAPPDSAPGAADAPTADAAIAGAVPEADPVPVAPLPLTTPTTVADTTLRIEHVDTTRYAAEGVVVIYADLVSNRSGTPIPLPEGTKVELFVDDQTLAADVVAKPFSASGEAIALGLLVPMHRSFTVEAQDAAGGKLIAADAIANGLAAIAAKVPDGSMVAAWVVDEASVRELAPFGTPAAQVARRIAGQRRTPRESYEAPQLYGAITKVIAGFAARVGDLPRRRVLLLVNDGKDPEQNDAQAIDKKISAIADAGAAIGLRIDVLGVTLDQPEPLARLGTLATKTGGTYRSLPFEEMPKLASYVADLGRAIGDQLVLEIKPKRDIGQEGPRVLRLELVSPDGTRVKQTLETVRLGPRKPTP